MPADFVGHAIVDVHLDDSPRYDSYNLTAGAASQTFADILEAIVTAVKMIGNAALEGLPGLTAMDPDGDFLNKMNAGVPTAAIAPSADHVP